MSKGGRREVERERVREREEGEGRVSERQRERAHLFIAGFYLTVWTDW